MCLKFSSKVNTVTGFFYYGWFLTKYDKVHTIKWWKPNNPKSYQNVYFNENFLKYKCKISCFQNFQGKSSQSRGFSIMCWFLTKYDKVHSKKWWKPQNPKSYQNVYFNKNLLQYKCKILCFQNFQIKSTQSWGFSIICWLLTK